MLFLVGAFLIDINVLFSLSTNSASPTNPVDRLKAFAYHQKLKQESIFKNLKWRSVGPTFRGGRVSCIAVPQGKDFTIYAGAGTGNIWKTTNNGTTWHPIFDNESTFTIGDMAIAQSNPDIIYVGTGENLLDRNSYAGTGVFKSTDGGDTWQNVGLNDTHHIGRVVIDPKNPDVVYVAALGHLYSYNEERGLFKTSDGGKTWDKILYVSEKAGVVDVAMDPSDSNILYASAWETIRKPWSFQESGKGSGLYKTADGGKNWKKLLNGFPQGEHVGRIGLAVSASNPNIVYALLDNHAKREVEEGSKSGLSILFIRRMSKNRFLQINTESLSRFLKENHVPEYYTAETILESVRNDELNPEVFAQYIQDLRDTLKVYSINIIGGEVFRSDDKGETWRKVNEDYLDQFFWASGYSFCNIKVSPDDEDQVYILGVRILSSEDGGKTYKHIGGKRVHVDHHDLWIDPNKSDRLILGNDGGVNFSYDRGETWQDIKNMPIGQFRRVSVDLDQPYKIYGGMQDNGTVYGPSDHTVEYGVEDPWKSISGGDGFNVLIDPMDSNTVYFVYQYGDLTRKNLTDGSVKNITPVPRAGEPQFRSNWNTPFIVSHHNPYTMYYGANKIFKSDNKGDSWISISPDLTTNPGPGRQGDVPYGTITTISESPLKPGLIYVGTDDGMVQVSQNEGRSWKKITKELPEKWVTCVVASRYEEGTVFISLTGYHEDDFEKYLFMSSDYGNNWVSITSNLPTESINVIREDPKIQNLLYIGTDLGVYVSMDRGEYWHSLCNNLPTTPVHDIAIHSQEGELIIGTYGRSVFTLDVSIIQQFDKKVQKKSAHLFKIRKAKLPQSRGDRGEWSLEKIREAYIYYYLREPQEIKISVVDKSGNLIKRLEGTKEPGLNLATWNLTFEGGAKLGEEFASLENFVKPGTYKVKIVLEDSQEIKKKVY